MNRGRGRGGPLNGIVHGAVSVVAEYRAHRKEVKAAAKQSRPRDDNNPTSSHPTALALSEHPADSEFDDATVRRDASPSREMRPILRTSEDQNDGHGSRLSTGSVEGCDRLSIEDDEASWRLDEATSLMYDEDEAPDASPDGLANDVLRLDHLSAREGTRQPLPYPVIIPQRRPHQKKRGFVRAYAPVLADSGIDQATFLQFIKSFQKSSQASPIFPVIQVAAGIASFTPSLIAMGVCMGVQVLATIGAEVQTRQRTNTFLDRMNDELFKPHGLYAMIIRYKPQPDGESPVEAQALDMSTNKIIAKCKLPDNLSRVSDHMSNLRLSRGTTKGAEALPEAAPLIFPDVDHAIALDGGKETFKDRTRDAQKFLNDYMDRRAQIKYASSDPNSALNLPEDKVRMRSKLSDPEHPMYSGHLVNLVTGGALNSVSQTRSPGRGGGDGFGGGLGGGFGGSAGGGGSAIFKKILQEDILYLLIVNMPSEADMEEARRTIDGSYR